MYIAAGHELASDFRPNPKFPRGRGGPFACRNEKTIHHPITIKCVDPLGREIDFYPFVSRRRGPQNSIHPFQFGKLGWRYGESMKFCMIVLAWFGERFPCDKLGERGRISQWLPGA